MLLGCCCLCYLFLLHAGGECGIVYERRLRMPTPPNIPADKRPEYYSYTMGPVAVIVLSTEQKWDQGSLQYK